MLSQNINIETGAVLWFGIVLYCLAHMLQLSVANLLFIDNPVGTGYSYVESKSAYATDVQQIADDLLTIFKVFINANPDFAVS